jgi:hypothetical protein
MNPAPNVIIGSEIKVMGTLPYLTSMLMSEVNIFVENVPLISTISGCPILLPVTWSPIEVENVYVYKF